MKKTPPSLSYPRIIHFRKRILLAVALLMSGCSYGQQQFNFTSSKDNNFCNGTCSLFDVPDLNGNPNAVIFITPVAVKGVNTDPHPICAYFNGKQWSVMNVDNTTMPLGSQFSVQYYAAPDANHFVHVVGKDNLVKNNSYIDHAGLNGNPKASFQLFQNASPNIRGGQVNKDDVKSQYDVANGEWFITSGKGKALDNATGYNISLSPDLTFKSMPAINSVPLNAAPVNAVPAVSNAVPAVSNAAPATSGGSTMRSLTGIDRIILSVTGSTQGQFVGLSAGFKMEITGFDLGVNSLTNGNSGQTTNIRQYTPLAIRRESDEASIQFFRAITGNELLTKVQLDMYKVGASGADQLDYSIILGNAGVSHFEQAYTKVASGIGGKMDSISIVFQTVSYVLAGGTGAAGTPVMDTWNK